MILQTPMRFTEVHLNWWVWVWDGLMVIKI